jgi:hypothetical protein
VDLALTHSLALSLSPNVWIGCLLQEEEEEEEEEEESTKKKGKGKKQKRKRTGGRQVHSRL